MASRPSYNLKNLVQRASDPTTGMVAGDVYFNTSIGMPRGYNGSQWLTLPLLGASIQAVLPADVAIAGITAGGITSTAWADVGIQADLSAVPTTGMWKAKIMGRAAWAALASATGVNVKGTPWEIHWRLVSTDGVNEAAAAEALFIGGGAALPAKPVSKTGEDWLTGANIARIYKLQHKIAAMDGTSTFTTTNTSSIVTHGGTVAVTPGAGFAPHATWIGFEQVAA